MRYEIKITSEWEYYSAVDEMRPRTIWRILTDSKEEAELVEEELRIGTSYIHRENDKVAVEWVNHTTPTPEEFKEIARIVNGINENMRRLKRYLQILQRETPQREE